MKDFLLFRRMMTPSMIQLLFWLGIAVCIYVGVFGLFTQRKIVGLCVLILGPLLVRLVCEYLVVQFKINDALQVIRREMETKTQ